MAEFTADVYQNEFLPDGGTDVHAIVTITCTGAGEAGRPARATPPRSSSSTPPARWAPTRSRPAADRRQAALDQILDGTWFAVIAGSHEARLAYPVGPGELGMVRMDPQHARRGQGRGVARSAPTAAPRWAPG